MRKFVIPRAVAGTQFASLQDVHHMDENFHALKGMKADPWPANVEFHMDPSFPKQLLLPDYVKNLHGDIVVSAAFKDLVQGLQTEGLQCLPVRIIDHKGKLASADYWYLNPYPLIDAIDQQRSQITWNQIDPERITACEQLVLAADRIPESVHLFRLRHMPSKPVMSDTLFQAIKAAGLTGIKADKLEDFGF